MLTVAVLGIAGAALLVEMFSVTTSGPAQIGPFFLMAVLAPIVMRLVIGVNTRRKMFVSCLAVGTVMSTVFLAWFAIVKNPGRAPWYAYAPGLGFLLGCVALTSAIIAIVTTNAAAADRRNVRGSLLGVLGSAGTFGTCYILIGLTGLLRHRSPGFVVLNTVSWGVFLAFFFILVSVLIYLPVLASFRRVLHQQARAPVAVLGALLFPIPMLAFPLLQGRLEAVARLLLQNHVALALAALPYVLAGATLGWLIAGPRHDVQHSI
jgi:MFS family permease